MSITQTSSVIVWFSPEFSVNRCDGRIQPSMNSGVAPVTVVTVLLGCISTTFNDAHLLLFAFVYDYCVRGFM